MSQFELKKDVRDVAMNFTVDIVIEAIRRDGESDHLSNPELTANYLESVYRKVFELIGDKRQESED
ncbi:hypothetical protein [Slackia exigua]|uniref:hypothetical protein n=1 Tax=Slackia exigua TaxID=84109 RepID=UPI0023F21916|nr:hypothetical protein [Slackia exigua]